MHKQKQTRDSLLSSWVNEQVGNDINLETLKGGASSKFIFRVTKENEKSILAMHIPPPEDLRQYELARQILKETGVRLPNTIKTDFEQNFALVEDLGDNLFSKVLNNEPSKQDELYKQAANCINLIQTAAVDNNKLPLYDQTLLDKELAFFSDYYCPNYCNKPLSKDELNDYQNICNILKQCFFKQHQVVIHRDFHSDNLLDIPDGPGIIDFAGARIGPQLFDMASLLVDVYQDIEEEVQLDYLIRQWEQAKLQKLPVAHDFNEYYDLFILTGLQRLVKILGQFVWFQEDSDDKQHYLEYIPKIRMHVHAIALRYRELRPLAIMIEDRIKS